LGLALGGLGRGLGITGGQGLQGLANIVQALNDGWWHGQAISLVQDVLFCSALTYNPICLNL
jgi:hypothetical protein